jgi:multidrug efflux pump subunit AcrA (membrane-fusion protein)
MESILMNKALSTIAALLATANAATVFAQSSAGGPVSDPVVSGLVKVADEIKLPGKEAGVLVQLSVLEGNQIRKGQVIGKIDDSQPQMQKQAALAAYNGAFNRATEDVEIRFAQAQAAVAQADYQQMVESNKIAEKSIVETEVRGKKLEWDKAILGTEKSRHDQVIAKFEALSKHAELDAAELAIQRRVVTAPFDGVVEEIKRHQDEWVQPGDTILTLLRMDTMRVEGAIEQSKYDPNEIINCTATVEVEMARGRKASFQGRIIKVSSVVRSDGVYNVRAEIANKQDHGYWLLRDGMPASMTIHLGTGAAGATGVSRAR